MPYFPLMATTPKNTIRDLRSEVHVDMDPMARDIYLALVKDTPKRSGAASRAWTKPENIRKDDYSAVISTNNLPYIPRLNEGYSKQAPPGYIEKAVDKVVRRYNK